VAGHDQQDAIAQVWAHSLLVLAGADGSEDALLDELDGLVELFEREPRVESLLAGPLVGDATKRALIETALRGRASDLFVDAVQVLRRKRRLGILRAVARAYRAGWLERRGRIEVRVSSATPLAADAREALTAAARRRTGREPIVSERVDPSLIGGLVVRIGDDKFDASIARELARFEHDLLEAGSRDLIAGKTYFTEDTQA
jgi:F-type H+-transporting ATPase subunit delta